MAFSNVTSYIWSCEVISSVSHQIDKNLWCVYSVYTLIALALLLLYLQFHHFDSMHICTNRCFNWYFLCMCVYGEENCSIYVYITTDDHTWNLSSLFVFSVFFLLLLCRAAHFWANLIRIDRFNLSHSFGWKVGVQYPFFSETYPCNRWGTAFLPTLLSKNRARIITNKKNSLWFENCNFRGFVVGS